MSYQVYKNDETTTYNNKKNHYVAAGTLVILRFEETFIYLKREEFNIKKYCIRKSYRF